MSSRLLRQRVLGSNGASHLRAAASRELNLTASSLCRPASASLAPNASPNSLLPPNRSSQIRLFHQTPTRRLFETTDQIISAGLGVGLGWLFFKAISKARFVHTIVSDLRNLPPGSWLRTASLDTIKAITAAVDAGFTMAGKAPEDRRHSALREASFSVPYEVARLNPDAKEFQIEDMGPVPPLPEHVKRDLDALAEALGESDGVLFDQHKDARTFLYFPNGSKKATAAFVAINADLPIPKSPEPIIRTDGPPSKPQRLLDQAMRAWIVQYHAMQDKKPEGTERLQTVSGKFPIIFCFRDKISGCDYDVGSEMFPEPSTIGMVFGLKEPTRVMGADS